MTRLDLLAIGCSSAELYIPDMGLSLPKENWTLEKTFVHRKGKEKVPKKNRSMLPQEVKMVSFDTLDAINRKIRGSITA